MATEPGTSTNSAMDQSRPTRSNGSSDRSESRKRSRGTSRETEKEKTARDSSREQLFRSFALGQPIWAINRGTWHKAKVMRIGEDAHPDDKTLMVPTYLIHYPGWPTRWDEWVMGDSMMGVDPESDAIAAAENARYGGGGKKLAEKALKKSSGNANKPTPTKADKTNKPTSVPSKPAIKLSSEISQAVRKRSSDSPVTPAKKAPRPKDVGGSARAVAAPATLTKMGPWKRDAEPPSVTKASATVNGNHTPVLSRPSPPVSSIDVIQKNCLKDYANLYSSHSTSDLTLVSADGMEFPVHRLILSARAPVFTASLSDTPQKKSSGRCVVDNVDGKTLNALLEFVYSGATDGAAGSAETLFAVANDFQLADLATVCEKSLIACIQVASAARFLILADKYHSAELKSGVLEYLKAGHAGEFVASDGLQELTEMMDVISDAETAANGLGLRDCSTRDDDQDDSFSHDLISCHSATTDSVWSVPDLSTASRGDSPRMTSGRWKKKKKKAVNVVLDVNPKCVAESIRNGLYRPSKAETGALSKLQEMFGRAVKFRDYYFDFFPVERASKRLQDISEIVAKSLIEITELGTIFKSRNLPWFFAYRALCLSVDTLRVKEAHEELQFAVRHLAHFSPLWIALGESYWEHSDYYLAVSCFEKAAMLDSTDVVPLVKLSCSLRLLLSAETDTTEKCKMLLRMVKMARDAVARCPDSGETWYNLGTSLLVYFSIKAQSELIVESLDAFKKASSCRVLLGKAEFHYNFGTANILFGNYEDAMERWKRAIALEPDWNSPKEKLAELVKYLVFVSDLVTGKDRTFRRRVKQLAESVPRKNLSSILNNTDSPSGTPHKLVSIKALVDGRNAGVMTHGKIYATTCHTPDPSRLIFLIDSTGESIPVVIYHMGVEFSVGGSVSIPDPVVRLVRLVLDRKEISFRYIRVDEPWLMYHNLIRVPRKQCAQAVVVTTPVPRIST